MSTDDAVFPASTQVGLSTRQISGAEAERNAVHWASLLAGLDETRQDAHSAEQSLRFWWQAECASIPERLHAQPEPFLNIRVAQQIRSIETCFEAIKPVLERLIEQERCFVETMAEVARLFNGDETRLTDWRSSAEGWSALVRWAPAFLHEQEYISRTFPMGQKELDESRTALLAAIDNPHEFFEAGRRATFDQRFLEFKKSYMDSYVSAHEAALQTMGPGESRVDTAALRNLETLSNLRHFDKTYLNRVRSIAHWVRSNQCNLPVREILERYPRCYCNFNPAWNRHATDSAEQINAAIREGIEYVRAVLRRCERKIIQELESMKVEDEQAKEIAVLLSKSPLVPLKPQSIDILTRIIERRRSDIQAAIREYRRCAPRSHSAHRHPQNFSAE